MQASRCRRACGHAGHSGRGQRTNCIVHSLHHVGPRIKLRLSALKVRALKFWRALQEATTPNTEPNKNTSLTGGRHWARPPAVCPTHATSSCWGESLAAECRSQILATTGTAQCRGIFESWSNLASSDRDREDINAAIKRLLGSQSP